jgi:hypothetical protein
MPVSYVFQFTIVEEKNKIAKVSSSLGLKGT